MEMNKTVPDSKEPIPLTPERLVATAPGNHWSDTAELLRLRSPHPAAKLGVLTADEARRARRALPDAERNKARNFDRLLGRAAAYRALRALGFSAPPAVLRGEGGMPLWPEGVVGSLTHSGGAAVALAGREPDIRAIGIDIQALRPSTRDISGRIAVLREEEWLKEVEDEQLLRTVLLFSAKESIYKALYPLGRRFFGFHSVELGWMPESRRFQATLLEDIGGGEGPPETRPGFSFEVGVEHLDGAVFTFVVLPGT
jgi:4'-phosphopantetheinyl transferase EntD